MPYVTKEIVVLWVLSHINKENLRKDSEGRLRKKLIRGQEKISREVKLEILAAAQKRELEKTERSHTF